MRFSLPLTLLVALTAGAEQPDAPALAWMAGCWTGQSGALTFEETWTTPAGGMLPGTARTLKEGRVVFSEFVRIEQKEDTLLYTPRIGATSTPVSFRMTRQSSGEVLFENPSHDFPQRILYRRAGDQLHARIEGVEKGKPRAHDFPMRRASCEAPR